MVESPPLFLSKRRGLKIAVLAPPYSPPNRFFRLAEKVPIYFREGGSSMYNLVGRKGVSLRVFSKPFLEPFFKVFLCMKTAQ